MMQIYNTLWPLSIDKTRIFPRFFTSRQKNHRKNFLNPKKTLIFALEIANRGVAQLAARHVRDVEVGSSSLLTPTFK